MAYSAMCSAPDLTKPGARGTAAWAAGPEEAAAPKWRKTQPKQWRKKSFDWGSTRILGRKRYPTYTQHYSTTKCPVMLGLLPCFMASFFRAQVYPGLKFVMRIFGRIVHPFFHIHHRTIFRFSYMFHSFGFFPMFRSKIVERIWKNPPDWSSPLAHMEAAHVKAS